MLLDRGLLEQQGARYEVTGPIEALEVPETLHALVAARIDGLTDEERQLVQDASVVGKTFPRSALAAVASIPEAEVERVLTALVRKEILSLQADPRSPERGQYGFLQDLLRQVAYETMPRGERKARHLAAAVQLEQEWTESEQETAEIVAFHYLTALELDPSAADATEIRKKARTTLIRAGDRAASLAGKESAQRYYEQALGLADAPLERAELHERAGKMAMLGERTEAARAHFEQAIAGFEDIGLTHPAARVTAQLGILIWQQEGDIERAIVEMERSLAVLADDEHDADLAMLAVQLSRPLLFAGRLDEALERNELALTIAEALKLPDVLSHGLNTKAIVLMTRGRHEEAELLLRHSLETALAHDRLEPALRAYINLVSVMATWDRYRDALELARAGVELARRVGDRSGEHVLRTWCAGMLQVLGRWDEALAEEALLDTDSPWPLFYLAWARLERGERAEVGRRVSAVKDVLDWNEVQDRAAFRAFEAHVAVADGKLREALTLAEDALGDRRELGIREVPFPLTAALDAAFALSDLAKVDELLAIIEELPPGDLTPDLRGVGARFSARRAALKEDPETASAGFVAAADIYRGIERPFDVAVVQLEHAEWLASTGRIDEAQPLLDETRGIFGRLRARPWLERVNRVGRAAAEPVAAD
ncbi:MAG: ATP-binding protein [Gaiellaceae bacterium]